MQNTLLVNGKNYKGYAFIDEDGRCIIIVYGERSRDYLIKNFENKIFI